MPHFLALDIGGTHFRVALFDSAGKKLSIYKGETLRSGGRDWMLSELDRRASALCRENTEPVKACGVSFGGPVDFNRQRVTSVHTPGWKDFALAAWVGQMLGVPCRVDNDANAGALGESRFGAGRGAESMVYITLSTGIGGGIICNGELHRGKDGMAGEIGHLPLGESDDLCTCGLKTGCTEALASGRALDRMARDLAMRHPGQAAQLLSLCGGNAESATARELVQAARAGDEAAASIFRGAVRNLAHALLMAIRLLDPEKIILGGGVAQAGDFLIQAIIEALKEWWSNQFPYTTEIALAALGDESPLYGAAALALEAVASDK
ncbi:MAG: ROK family protein [Terriglobia bacterium]